MIFGLAPEEMPSLVPQAALADAARQLQLGTCMPLRGWTLPSTCPLPSRQHRAQHAANLLWAAHVAHHSSPGAKQLLVDLSWCHQLATCSACFAVLWASVAA